MDSVLFKQALKDYLKKTNAFSEEIFTSLPWDALSKYDIFWKKN